MKERPILFSGPMVRALLHGSKTQTRRVVKAAAMVGGWETAHNRRGDVVDRWPLGRHLKHAPCPYGQPGDRLWVRETFYCDNAFYPNGVGVAGKWREVNGQRVPIPLEEQHAEMLESMYYRADGEPEFEAPESPTPWRPSIHMPRWASRITLDITCVRVERLQDISRGDAMSEGCPFPNMAQGDDPRIWYAGLWNAINGAASWDLNPWVWVVEFKRVTPCP